MNARVLVSAGLVVGLLVSGLTGCAATGDPGASDDSFLNEESQRGGKVSGFDLQGPKALPATDVKCAFHVQPEEEIACAKVGGTSTQAADCAILCSKPIAKEGTVAGFGFDGYRQLASEQVVCDFHQAPEEDVACSAVGGDVIAAADCARLCSKPIARKGTVAGFDLEGFKILPNDSVPVEFCAAVVSPVQEGCGAVGGELSHANGCAQLCSLPL